MIEIKQKGNFKNLKKYIGQITIASTFTVAETVTKNCIEKLKEATPKKTGLTAASWDYTIQKNKSGIITIIILNKNIQNGINIALLLEYGHGTASGYWIEGKHYIEPIVREAYDKILKDTIQEVTKQ